MFSEKLEFSRLKGSVCTAFFETEYLTGIIKRINDKFCLLVALVIEELKKMSLAVDRLALQKLDIKVLLRKKYLTCKKGDSFPVSETAFPFVSDLKNSLSFVMVIHHIPYILQAGGFKHFYF